MPELADNILEVFRRRLSLMEQDIKLSVMEAFTSEVVVTRMAKLDRYKSVLGAEVVKKGGS